MAKGLVLLIVFGIAFLPPVNAEETQDDYWEKIRGHIEAVMHEDAGEQEARAAKEYMASLSPQQLIIGGRQATHWLAQRIPSFDASHVTWKTYAWPMAWFYEQYPENTDGLSNIEPLLDEIRNNNISPYWRYYLSHLLSESWESDGLLNNTQRREVSQTLLSVLEREDEHPAVVAGAAEGLPQTLAALKEDLPPAEEAKERREALRALTGFSERYLKTAAVLVSEPEGDAAVLRATLGGLVRVAELGVAETGAARAALRKAARNFASYPEELWPHLMLTAVKLRAEADFEKLLAEASDAAEQEQVAERLGAVRSLLDKTQVAAARKEDKEGDTKAPAVRRLSDCSPAELLVMARHRADLLAQGRVGEGAWSELSAILQEYESRPEPR